MGDLKLATSILTIFRQEVDWDTFGSPEQLNFKFTFSF